MRLLCVTAAALLGANATAAQTPMAPNSPLAPPQADCPPTAAQQVAQRLTREGHKPRLHLLDDFPPASAYAAVLRRVNGCEAPVIIRYDIQGTGEARE